MRFLVGFILIIVGFLIIWKRQKLVHAFPPVQVFVKYLGSMYGFYLIFGIVLIFSGLLWMTGRLQTLLENIFPGA